MINYQLIADAIKYYSELGFEQIETPWTVTKEISAITAPKDATFFTVKEKNKVLVASAEQGFLYLMNKGFLPKGKYQSVSPCFRDESFDVTHTKYFIKNELIDTLLPNCKKLHTLVDNAFQFFINLVPVRENLKVKEVSKYQFDIEYNGIELGSYGMRNTPIGNYLYGTAIAEPRFSRAIYGVS